ncbi:hypothetical protein [Streptomyces sp. NPDC059080]|uniref:hypothetical protein n=1 Tax=Streptomyces sp. NPDC059080 TaxID=3346718 RepID=UPI00368B9128
MAFAESLAELATSVDQICTRAGIPAEPSAPASAARTGGEPQGEFDFAFNALEQAAIHTAAEAAGLTPGDYVEVLSASLLAASRITDACVEISGSLLEDARYILNEAADQLSVGNDPNSLSTLVRSLLARVEAAG